MILEKYTTAQRCIFYRETLCSTCSFTGRHTREVIWKLMEDWSHHIQMNMGNFKIHVYDRINEERQTDIYFKISTFATLLQIQSTVNKKLMVL